MASVLEPFDLGPIRLNNRLVMGPMTRARCPTGTPNAIMAEYYAQRASAGLILTEGVWPEINAQGYFSTPGIENDEQTAGWKAVTDAVHARGGKIFMQLMHCGRVGDPVNNGGHQLVAPSAVQADFQILTVGDDGNVQLVRMAMPRALETDEVDGVLDGLERAAVNAKAAGFDGIELHAASGYLPMQFLSTNTNQRDDKWGGTPEKRTRFTIEAMERLFNVFGPERTGIKIAPGILYNDINDAEVEPTYDLLVRKLDAMKPAYLHFQTSLSYQHLNEFSTVASTEGQVEVWHHWPYQFLRDRFTGPIIASGDLTLDLAQKTLDAGMADLFVFGRRYISNPDLFERFKAGADLADPNQMTIYGGAEAGYTDYPAMAG
ncbi:alkene reductase [Sphingomonas crocodyli]|uniref:Alkene reductase n=1 Tax=Sphingomonas crocodyli TaxID=1979270 RepID=A0A437M680_9SPHN|nr:alkene reductase [Sphingomonas crocodyli]RVT93182.1 alkene reductase [Sphingomonas crocodyli]